MPLPLGEQLTQCCGGAADCMLSAVGKPVYHRHTDSNFGSWMRDPNPREPRREPRYWTTDPSDNNHLYEFADKNRYRKNIPSKNYTLSRPFTVSLSLNIPLTRSALT